MVIGFQETMRGAVLDRGGEERPVDFEVATTQVGRGSFTLKGVVHAPPWAPASPATGTLEMDLWARTLSYRLRFPGKDGRACDLSGLKRWTPRAPVHSLTCMPVTLRRQDGSLELAGEMRFSLLDLPAFLLSWLPVRSARRARLDVVRRALERRLLAGT